MQAARRTLSTANSSLTAVKVSVVPSPLDRQAGSRSLMCEAPMNSELISNAGNARPMDRMSVSAFMSYMIEMASRIENKGMRHVSNPRRFSI